MVNETLLASQAAANHGLLPRTWLLSQDMTPDHIRHRLESGRWVLVHPGVYRVAAVPRTWHQRLHAACLAAGPHAAVSHRAALALWELDGGQPGVVEVAVPRLQWPRLRGVLAVHRSTDLAEAQVVMRHGVRVTNPMRTLVDLGAVLRKEAVGRAYDHARGKGLVTRAGVERMVTDLGRRSRRGVGVMRQVLDERADAPKVAGILEGRMAALLRAAGLPVPEAEHDVYAGETWIARVDFAFVRLLIAIEVDGEERHGGSLQHDLARQNALVEAG